MVNDCSLSRRTLPRYEASLTRSAQHLFAPRWARLRRSSTRGHPRCHRVSGWLVGAAAQDRMRDPRGPCQLRAGGREGELMPSLQAPAARAPAHGFVNRHSDAGLGPVACPCHLVGPLQNSENELLPSPCANRVGFDHRLQPSAGFTPACAGCRARRQASRGASGRDRPSCFTARPPTRSLRRALVGRNPELHSMWQVHAMLRSPSGFRRAHARRKATSRHRGDLAPLKGR